MDICGDGLVGSAGCSGCKQVFEVFSHVLCDCEAWVVLRFKLLGHHFFKTGDFTNISISKRKGLHRRLKMVEVQGSLWCPPLCILFYIPSYCLMHKVTTGSFSMTLTSICQSTLRHIPQDHSLEIK